MMCAAFRKEERRQGGEGNNINQRNGHPSIGTVSSYYNSHKGHIMSPSSSSSSPSPSMIIIITL